MVSGKEVPLPLTTKLLFDKYQIVRFLKANQDTEVCLARHTALDKDFVIKRVRRNGEVCERFYRETQILKHLKHPHIPLLYDIKKDEDYNYIIEEYVEGESLRTIVEQQVLSVSTAVRYMIQLCEILEYLHGHDKGQILYLDCQPDNLIIKEGEVNLIDFGNSIFASDSGRLIRRYGTVGYAAPEMYYGGSPPVQQTDIYGAGALLYYMLTGDIPSSKKNPNNKKLPKRLRNIIKKCMHHRPRQRYGSVAELHKELETLKPEKLKKEAASLVISVAGIDRRTGVTHLALSLAGYLRRKGYYCLFTEQNVPGILMKLMECHEKEYLRVKNGIFLYKKISMLPYYGRTVDNEIKSITDNAGRPFAIINDFGCLDGDNAGQYGKADACLLLVGGKPWEMQDFIQNPPAYPEDKVITVVNFAAGNHFYRFAGLHGRRFLRMPYFADWQRPTTAGEYFMEQLFNEIMRKGNE